MTCQNEAKQTKPRRGRGLGGGGNNHTDLPCILCNTITWVKIRFIFKLTHTCEF